MGETVDYYDVQNMLRDERSVIRGEIDRVVDDAKRELRQEIADLRDDISSLYRILNARTEGLV